jgi:hypothetical protein
VPSLFPDVRVQPVGEGRDPPVDPGSSQRLHQLAVGGVGGGEPEVLPDRRVEQMSFLAGPREDAADVPLPIIPERAPGS